FVQRSDRKIIVKRAESPKNADKKNQPDKGPKYEPNRAQLFQGTGAHAIADSKVARFQFLFEPGRRVSRKRDQYTLVAGLIRKFLNLRSKRSRAGGPRRIIPL